MLKRTVAAALLLAAMISLSACSSLYEKEYLVIKDHVPPTQNGSSGQDDVTVHNFTALRHSILRFAYAGQTQGRIVFSPNYDGDPLEDLASACWQVRTQDALCAYCVENIAYELDRIVTTDEATVYISYSSFCVSADKIVQLPFSYAVEDTLKKALETRTRQLVVLIGRSTYDADQISALVTKIYRESPTIVPKELVVSVDMYSGTGYQRLYQISINYGLSSAELEQRMAALEAVDAFSQLDRSQLSEGQLAMIACRYLMDDCSPSDSPLDNTAYSALVERRANSEGCALAYVELCRQLGLECAVVYGQRMWQDHCWNIVQVDGSYYHVDIAQCLSFGLEGNFLMDDERFWGSYRWDVSAYPKCQGSLKLSDIAELPQ